MENLKKLWLRQVHELTYTLQTKDEQELRFQQKKPEFKRNYRAEWTWKRKDFDQTPWNEERKASRNEERCLKVASLKEKQKMEDKEKRNDTTTKTATKKVHKQMKIEKEGKKRTNLSGNWKKQPQRRIEHQKSKRKNWAKRTFVFATSVGGMVEVFWVILRQFFLQNPGTYSKCELFVKVLVFSDVRKLLFDFSKYRNTGTRRTKKPWVLCDKRKRNVD